MSTHAIQTWFSVCDDCRWQSPQKASQAIAQQALDSHQKRRCRVRAAARRAVAPKMKGTYDGSNSRPQRTRQEIEQ